MKRPTGQTIESAALVLCFCLAAFWFVLAGWAVSPALGYAVTGTISALIAWMLLPE